MTLSNSKNENTLIFIIISLTIILTLYFFTKSSSIGGGNEVGNGAQVIACKDNSNDQISYQFYDRFEVQFYNPDWAVNKKIETFETLDNKMLYLLSILNKLDPERSSKYQTWWKNFWEETKFISKSSTVKLKTTEDTLGGLVPQNDSCRIKNVAFQHTYKFHYKYLIDEHVFTQLSPIDQFMVILHEIIYRDLIESGISQDSRNVRYLTTFLISQQFSDLANNNNRLNQEKYLSILEEKHLNKPWMVPDQLGFVIFLYKEILQRDPETDFVVENWSRHCTKSGPQQLLIEFLNSVEAHDHNLSSDQWLSNIKKATGVKKIQSNLIEDWRTEFLINKKRANIKLISQLVRRNLDCIHFVHSHGEYMKQIKMASK